MKIFHTQSTPGSRYVHYQRKRLLCRVNYPGGKYTALYSAVWLKFASAAVAHFGGNKVQPRRVDSFRIENISGFPLFRRATISGSIHPIIASHGSLSS